MAHHLLPDVDRSWLNKVANCFLIRDPAEVIASYVRTNPDPVMVDLGFVQQAELFQSVKQETGTTPPVIDARDLLENPARILSSFCERVGVEFDDAMLLWPPGLRDTDGVWAKYWYAEVAKTTSFQPYRPKNEVLASQWQDLYGQCLDHYRELHQYRLM
jgi:hypothetical protein